MGVSMEDIIFFFFIEKKKKSLKVVFFLEDGKTRKTWRTTNENFRRG